MSLRKPDAYLWKPSAIMNSPRVEELSPLEELWYRRALDRSFDDEGISADPAKAAIRIGRKCTPQAAKKILDIFFVPKPRDPSKMVNPRQEIERKNAIKALKRFSDAGKESGRKRRERKQLTAEQRSNDVRTINKEINKVKEEESSNTTESVIPGARPAPVASPTLPRTEPRPEPKTLPVEIFCGLVSTGILRRLRLKSFTPADRSDWEKFCRWAFANNFSPDDVLECYDLLKQQPWRDAAITTKTLSKELPNLNDLRSPKPIQTNGKSSPTKRTDADVIAESADFYRDWKEQEERDLPN